jgi:hypothetical protein
MSLLCEGRSDSDNLADGGGHQREAPKDNVDVLYVSRLPAMTSNG